MTATDLAPSEAGDQDQAGPDRSTTATGPAPVDADADAVGQDAGRPRRRWRWLAPAVLVALVPYLIVVVATLAKVNRPWLSNGDYALIEMSTRSALHGDALLGPYSRFGWNHPGPAVFYWFAPFYRLFGQTPESLGVATAVLNTIAAATAVVVAGVASGRRAAWVVASWSAGVVLVWGFPWIDHIWNPFIVLSVIVASGFLAAAVLAGHRWMLAPFVLATTFVVQTHVGSLPLVALLAVAVVLGAGWSLGRDWRRWWVPTLTGVATAATGWALPVWEQVTGRPGNLTEIARFFEDRSSGGHGFGDVLDKVAVQLTLTKVGLISSVVSVRRPPPSATGARVGLLVAMLVFVAVGIVVNRRRGRRFEMYLCVVSLLGVVGVFVAGMRVVGELEGYLTLPALAVGATLWAALALTVTGLAADRFERPRRIAPLAWATAFVATAWLGIWMVAQGPAQFLQVRDRPQAVAQAVDTELQASLGDGSQAVLIRPADTGSVSTAAQVANAIERGGHPVQARASWDYLFGRSRRTNGCESFEVSVSGFMAGPAPGRGSVVGVLADRTIQLRTLDPPPRCRPDGSRPG